MKLSKIAKELGSDLMNTMASFDETGLKNALALSEGAIDEARRQRDANPNYVSAKENVKALSEGLKEVRKFQSAKIAYALRRLRELSGEVLEDEES